MGWWQGWRPLAVTVMVAAVLAGCSSVVRDQSLGEYADDSAITAKVKTRLAREPGVNALKISVDTLNGVVILTGFVDNDTQREKAIAAARGVAGVQDVNGNALVVKPERSEN